MERERHTHTHSHTERGGGGKREREALCSSEAFLVISFSENSRARYFN